MEWLVSAPLECRANHPVLGDYGKCIALTNGASRVSACLQSMKDQRRRERQVGWRYACRADDTRAHRVDAGASRMAAARAVKLPLAFLSARRQSGRMVALATYANDCGKRRPTLVQRVRTLLVVGLLLGLLPVSPAPLHAETVQQAIDRIQADSSYQTALEQRREPAKKREVTATGPHWFGNLFHWLSGSGKWLINGIAIVLVGLAILAILYLTVPAVREGVDGLRARLRRKSGGKKSDEADEGWRPDETHALDLLASADALAREHRFAEAVRLLMTRSVEEITHRRPGVVRPAYTARAIAGLEDLPELARAAFARVGVVVERGIWAQAPLVEGDWQEARSAYQDFAFGPHWRRARS